LIADANQEEKISLRLFGWFHFARFAVKFCFNAKRAKIEDAKQRKEKLYIQSASTLILHSFIYQ
jgi:hypothetical protein